MEICIDFSSLGKIALDRAIALCGAVIPPTCLNCEGFVGQSGGCCASCWQEMRFISKPMCPVTGTPYSVDLGENFLSAEAIANPPPYEHLRAVMLYDRIARKMVSLLKYSDRTDLAPWMANWMAIAGRQLLKEADIVVPVPLHGRRLRARRFNQAAELARMIARQAGKKYAPELLERKKSTKQQVGLTERERERNVTGAFLVPLEHKIHLNGKRVVLIDDVYTTGATTKAATRALKRGGANAVDVVVFAKVEMSLI